MSTGSQYFNLDESSEHRRASKHDEYSKGPQIFRASCTRTEREIHRNKIQFSTWTRLPTPTYKFISRCKWCHNSNLPLLLDGVEPLCRSVTRSLYRPVRRLAAMLGYTTGGGSTLSIQTSMTTWRAHAIPFPFPRVTPACDNPEAEHLAFCIHQEIYKP